MSEYTAANITVLDFDESVRRRPGMYFGADAHLATSVLTAVVIASLHPGPRVAPTGPPEVTAEILDDLALSIIDNWPTGPDGSTAGYYGSLLTSYRWVQAAAAAVSTHSVIETWQAGHAQHQDLAGLRPAGPVHDFDAPGGTGTKLTITPTRPTSRRPPSTPPPSTSTPKAAATSPGQFHLCDSRPTGSWLGRGGHRPL